MKFDLRHYLAVASHFRPFSRRWFLALLHDGIEDGWLSFAVLRRLPQKFRHDIVGLTRTGKETYGDYIEGLFAWGSSDAIAVKRADLTENLKRCSPSLARRYRKALEALEGRK